MPPDGPFVFVHGWQGNRSVWREVIQALGPDFRCVDIDLRGGGELRDVPGPYTVERYAADLRELIEGLDAGPAVVVGHSMGAKIALRLAIDGPQLVRRLVLIAPVAVSCAGFSEKGVARLRATVSEPAALREWLGRCFYREPSAEALQRLGDAAACTSPDAALQSLDSWMNTDLAASASAVEVPALVIAPEHDNVEMQRHKVAELLPNAEFVVLPDSGHYAMLEKPREVAAVIARSPRLRSAPRLRSG